MLGQKLRVKYPDRVPVIVESKDIDISHKKYLVPSSHNIAQFMAMLRTQASVDNKEALFLLINNTLVPNNVQFSTVYESYKNADDEILYIYLSKENTFG